MRIQKPETAGVGRVPTPRQMAETLGLDYEGLPEYMTSYELAKVLGTRTWNHIRQRAKQGHIPCQVVALGRVKIRLIHRDDGVRYAYRRYTGPRAQDPGGVPRAGSRREAYPEEVSP